MDFEMSNLDYQKTLNPIINNNANVKNKTVSPAARFFKNNRSDWATWMGSGQQNYQQTQNERDENIFLLKTQLTTLTTALYTV